MKITTLKHLAQAINALDNGYTAVTEKSWTSTDRHPRGVRFRIAGKGRNGTKLTVKDPGGAEVFRCDTSETTPIYIAITKAIEIFGSKLDLDPGELFEVGQNVRLVSYTPLYGTVVAVIMKNKTQAKRYKVKLRNGHVTDVQPWEVRPS